MGYWIDRTRAFRDCEVVAALNVRRHGARMRALLADGSLYDTRTRPQTFARRAGAGFTHDEGRVWPSEHTPPRE